ncbi:hypothetical protein FQA47_012380 [Oryzias melastigma]|uniref:Uncharacterized protein n=1 Tax=Oryzias melastigma TaxID=30732 RepID=A0A834L1J7_ORYME|nr:hypothetical protein FQA47_012380 [Oryzias melastigma]
MTDKFVLHAQTTFFFIQTKKTVQRCTIVLQNRDFTEEWCAIYVLLQQPSNVTVKQRMVSELLLLCPLIHGIHELNQRSSEIQSRKCHRRNFSRQSECALSIKIHITPWIRMSNHL